MKLNPSEPDFLYKTDNLEVKLKTCASAPFNSCFKGSDEYIKNNDVFWKYPNTIFDTAGDYASDMHEIKQKAVKWIANPFLYSPEAAKSM